MVEKRLRVGTPKKRRNKPSQKEEIRWPQEKIDHLLENVRFESPVVNEWHENTPKPEKTTKSTPIENNARIGIIGRGPLVKIMKQQLHATLFPWPPKLANVKNIEVLIVSAVGHLKIKFLRHFVKKRPSVRIFLWWTGTDVLHALKEKRSFLKTVKATHLCVSKNLQAELQSIGIESEILTIPPIKHIKPKPPPSKYTVVSYIPNDKLDFYGWKKVVRIAQLCPNIQFIVYGAKTLTMKKPTNLKILGWIDTNKLLQNSNCLLRLTKHDGFAKCIIEAKRHNRVVITNHNLPYVVQMSNPEKIAKFLKTKPQPSKTGYKFYQQFTYKTIKRRFGR